MLTFIEMNNKCLLRAPAVRRGMPFACEHQPVIVFAQDQQGKEKRVPWGLSFPREPWARILLARLQVLWETRKVHPLKDTLGTYQIFDLSQFTSPGLSLHTSKVGLGDHF